MLVDTEGEISDIRKSICSRMSSSRLSTVRKPQKEELDETDFNTTKVSRRDSEILRGVLTVFEENKIFIKFFA